MLLLEIILVSFIYDISGKMYYPDDKDELDSDSSNHGVIYINGDPLWVLHLNNEKWLDAKLTLGNFAEEEDFYYAAGRTVKGGSNSPQSSLRVKKDDPEHPKKLLQNINRRSNNDLRKDIMKLINKFVLHTSSEPDAYVKENADGSNPSMTLYFKGSMSCLIVKQGSKEWHYVIRATLFPNWFYERHDTFVSPLDIPDIVKNEFYYSLFRFLRLVVYHPI